MRISGLSISAILLIVIAAVSLPYFADGKGVVLSADDDGVPSTGCIVINEVMYDPKILNSSDRESDYEWIELYNACDETIELVGWNILDNYGSKGDSIPSLNITSKGFAVIAVSEAFYESHPDYSGTIVFIEDGKIGGNGLGNSGDCITLKDNMGIVVDEMSYGDNAAKEGHSLERSPAGYGSFIENNNPTPGFGWSDVTPTPTLPPTPEPTYTPEPTPTPTIPTSSPTPTPTSTSTPTPLPTPEPTVTPTPTPTSTPTSTPSPTPTPTPLPTHAGTIASRGDVLINEVQYNPPQSGSESGYEWFELYNTREFVILLSGWSISDNYSSDTIPQLNISPGGFAVIAASPAFYENFPDYTGDIVFVDDGRIGNGLGNDGDCLILRDVEGNVIDELSYGDNDSITSSPMKKVAEGHSMERQPAGGSFIDNSEPTPGTGLPPPTPTPVPTPSPSPTPSVSPTPAVPGTVADRSDIVINEVQYNPPQSGSESGYEWFELYNTRDCAISLSGWRVSDNYSSDTIPLANISPHGFLVVAASSAFHENFPNYTGAIVFIEDGRIGNGLGNNGDSLILRDSDDNVIDALSYGEDDSITSTPHAKVGEGHSMERCPSGGSFIDNSEPTPGSGLNACFSIPEASPTATNSSVGTVANRSAVLINEVQNNPVQPGSDTAWEWIELYNPGIEAVDLIGWKISDNHDADDIPALNLPAGELVVVAASGNFSDNFPDYDGAIVFIADGRIGNGLGNGGDHLVLKDSAGTTIDEISYGDDDSITSPPWPDVVESHSLERSPCGGQFIDNDAPTPGRCLAIISNSVDCVDTEPVAPVSDESDLDMKHKQQSMDESLSASGKAYTTSSREKPGDFPGVSLSALFITLSLSLVSTLCWILYRRKSG